MPTDADIRDALRQVVDPELGINVVDLGLVYRIDVEETRVRVAMTTTSPACPLTEYLRELADSAIRERVPGITDVAIEFESDPPWDPEMMSDEARRQLDGGDPR